VYESISTKGFVPVNRGGTGKKPAVYCPPDITVVDKNIHVDWPVKDVLVEI
jgi:hypothetical protein